MPSLFQTRFEARVRTAEKRAFGVAVMLRQSGISTEEFTATWHNKDHSVKGKDGSFLTTVRTRDYTLPAISLVLAGKTVEPKPGAVITETESGERFQIVAVGEMPAVDREAGNYRWLVHTTRISSG